MWWLRKAHNTEEAKLVYIQRPNKNNKYLIPKGITSERIIMEAHGESKLKTQNKYSLQLNRRVELEFIMKWDYSCLRFIINTPSGVMSSS